MSSDTSFDDDIRRAAGLGNPTKGFLHKLKEAAPPVRWTFPPNYQILGKPKAGGMGVVVRARKKNGPLRDVALKIIKPKSFRSEDQIPRFLHEMKTLSKCVHPHIVPVLDADELDGQPFFTMAWVEGCSLEDAKDRFHAKPLQTARLMEMLARAIHYAHQHGIIHRDLKPSNIMIDNADEPHVIDFGLAKGVDAEDMPTEIPVATFAPPTVLPSTVTNFYTKVEGVAGTPHYMSPEQTMVGASLTMVSDVFSIGVILYELLVGERPFQGNTHAEIFENIRKKNPPRPHEVNPEAPRDLSEICMKCLEKEPTKRYQSAHGLAEDLRRYQHNEPIAARRYSWRERVQLWRRRQPVAAKLLIASAVLALVSFLAIVAGFSGTVWYASRLSTEVAAKEAARKEAADNLKLASKERDEKEIQRKKAEENLNLALKERDEKEAERKKAEQALGYGLQAITGSNLLIEVSEGKLADLPGMLPVRKEMLTAAASIREAMRSLGSKDIELHRRLASTYNHLGSVHLEMGQPEIAEKNFRAAFIQYIILDGKAPDDHRIKAGMAASLNNLGNILFQKKEYDAAIAKYREALGIVDTIDDPFGKVMIQNHIAGAYGAKTKDFSFEEALAEADKAFKLATEYQKAKPVESQRKEFLVQILFTLGVINNRAEKHATALEYHHQAKKLSEELVAGNPKHVERRDALARAFFNIGSCHEARAKSYQKKMDKVKAVEDFGQAELFFRDARNAWDVLNKEDKDNPGHKKNAGQANKRMIEVKEILEAIQHAPPGPQSRLHAPAWMKCTGSELRTW